MQYVKLIRKGFFPLRKLKVLINGVEYHMASNNIIDLNLQTKDYKITLKMDWWESSKIITVNNKKNNFYIKFCLPDWYFILGILVILCLGAMVIFYHLNILVFIIFVLFFIIPQFYFLFIEKDRYFIIHK